MSNGTGNQWWNVISLGPQPEQTSCIFRLWRGKCGPVPQGFRLWVMTGLVYISRGSFFGFSPRRAG